MLHLVPFALACIYPTMPSSCIKKVCKDIGISLFPEPTITDIYELINLSYIYIGDVSLPLWPWKCQTYLLWPLKLHKGSISLNYFRVNLLTLFYKLDHFINIINIHGIFMKRSSLQNRVSKFTPKKFYEIDPKLHQRTTKCFLMGLEKPMTLKRNANLQGEIAHVNSP